MSVRRIEKKGLFSPSQRRNMPAPRKLIVPAKKPDVTYIEWEERTTSRTTRTHVVSASHASPPSASPEEPATSQVDRSAANIVFKDSECEAQTTVVDDDGLVEQTILVRNTLVCSTSVKSACSLIRPPVSERLHEAMVASSSNLPGHHSFHGGSRG